jgi:hypothetical protein
VNSSPLCHQHPLLMAVGTVYSYVLVGAADSAMQDAQHFVLQVRSFVVVIVITMPYDVARLTPAPRHPWISGRQPHLSLLW